MKIFLKIDYNNISGWPKVWLAFNIGREIYTDEK